MSRVWTAEDLSELETNELSPLGVDTSVDDEADVNDDPAAAAAGEAEAPKTEEFRYGNDAPEEIRGKTATEVAALYQAQQTVARTLVEQVRRSNPAPPVAPAEEIRLTEEDLLGTDPDKVNEKINKMQDAKMQPLINDYHQKESLAVYEKMRTNPANKYFQKYENEILAMARQLPANQTSNPVTWNLLYNGVIGAHAQEIIAEEIAAATAANAPAKVAPPVSERGNNRSAVTVAPANGSLTKEERQIARNLGVSEEEYLKYKQ